jgi:hypothetical protein
MTGITIRAARPKDAAAIARLSAELNEVVNASTEHCTPENIKTTLFSHDASFHVLVAEKDGEPDCLARLPFRPAYARL